MTYIQKIISQIQQRYAHEPEFIQAVEEVLLSLEQVLEVHPEFEKNAVLERLVEPERAIIFRVPWVNAQGRIEVNRGFRVQHCSALGPYKGGLRFDPTVNLSVLKFLAFEQTFKNALTTLPLGGGKGGSDFNPKGKTENEIMTFCQSFVNELYRHIGADCDIPAGDLGVGAREIGYMAGQYRRLTGRFDGTFTGKGLGAGGSLGRKEATGFGLIYLTELMLEDFGKSIKAKRVLISGAGNVAIHAAQKAIECGAIVVGISDRDGCIYDKKGIDIAIIRQIKEKEQNQLSSYAQIKSDSEYYDCPSMLWSKACDIALPCATQNEIDEASARQLVKNGCIAVAEGANMPCTPQAINVFKQNNVLYAPGKAANAGGVSVSCLEMSQNSAHLYWTFEDVDTKLRQIMSSIYSQISSAAKKYATPTDLEKGANIAGFLRVASALLEGGVI